MPFDGSHSFHSPPVPGVAPAPVIHRVRNGLAQVRQLLLRGLWHPVEPASRLAERERTGTAVVALLQLARTLIEPAAAWSQGTYRTSDNRRCAIGALRAAAQRKRYGAGISRQAHAMLLAVAGTCGFTSVEAMNDCVSHAEVLGAFDAAITLATAHRQHRAGC